MPNLIEMSNISKAFGGSVALRGVSLQLMPGSVHALMGENGAGKSTLMKILAGVHQPDEGDIFKNGHKVAFANPREALDFGISTVFQELSLLPNLTIAENMFLGREPVGRFGFVDREKMHRQTREALAELGLNLDPSRLVSELSIAERQFVEIAHGIDADADIFILDEPTAALNAADVDVLNSHIRRLKSEGKAVVYISHRMDEIFTVCDTVTVLKDGQLVSTRPLAEMTPSSLIAMMVGRELEDLFPARGSNTGEVALELKHLKLHETSRPISLTVRKGEIVALAGLEGQGQQKVLRALVGEFKPFSGTATILGDPVSLPIHGAGGIRQMQRRRVGFIPEDRKEEGLFLGLPISHNLTASLHSGRPAWSAAKAYHDIVSSTMQRMNVRASGAQLDVGALSGGNQQKVLLGRYLAADLDVLLVEEPTRGVDIGAKSEIYKLLREFASRGGAVLVLSRETIELIGLCDRIYVIHDNAIAAEMDAAEATEHKILDAALSVRNETSET